ncbi:TIM-barrel domain-containing protein [Ferruginibacter sp. HRS2-29]|uniref:TIM-barrel domain-containing protein n=1 Tax=Ferruginibacter sp. HRS2-29 TaxID=2487334 RepID=UPI0020CDAEFD|nr:TIM-barrel domain-containing protein [Ferruginibacter sp. HRS2-29]MCP9750313.1 glycosyl hydrolase [Ferruginibacter sp. HRS2-29]
MKFFIAFIFIFTIVCNSSAQEAPVQTIQLANGKVTCIKYSGNIYKLVYLPTGYTRNELISDAVIARPNSVGQPLKAIEAKDDKIVFSFENFLGQIQPFTKDGNNGFRFQLSKTEKVFGGGERALPLNRRGYKFNLYNNPWYGYSEGADNLNYSVPFFTTSDGYGLFFDNPSKGYADIGKSDSTILEVGFSSGELNVYVIFGKDYKEILAGYNQLTGTQPLPPRWALGNLMSRFGYTSEAQAKDILGKMQSENIPVDAIIFDLFWFGDSIKGTMGNLDWVNKKKWPDPKKMIADFKKQQVQTILITEPFVVKSSANYTASKNFLAVDSTNKPYTIADFYFGAGGLIDIFRKDAQDWFWSKHRPQMKNGVEAWWGDLGEPEKHPANLYHNLKDLGFNKRLFKADEVHNLYGHTWTKMLYEKYAKEYPSKRLFSLNRSGFAGTQRYGIFPWSGDVSRSWSGLRAQLPIMLGMSMSGIPYAHADAGGFAGGEGDNELYVRWLQFAAFTPIFRPHGTALYSVDTATFSFPSEAALIAEPFATYARNAIKMRYLLLPYNYTLAYKQATYGAPLVAPLYYHFPHDTAVINISDEYMWGDNILVAPVTQKNKKIKEVYLPEGNWYDLRTNDIKKGKTSDSLSLETIPVYVKEGSFIHFLTPSDSHRGSASNFSLNDVTTIYYPSTDSTTGILYMDDGVTKGVKGEIISFTGITKNNRCRITIKSTKEMGKRIIHIRLPGDLNYYNTGAINGKDISEYDIVKDTYFLTRPSSLYTGINIEFSGKPVIFEFQLDKKTF